MLVCRGYLLFYKDIYNFSWYYIFIYFGFGQKNLVNFFHFSGELKNLKKINKLYGKVKFSLVLYIVSNVFYMLIQKTQNLDLSCFIKMSQISRIEIENIFRYQIYYQSVLFGHSEHKY